MINEEHNNLISAWGDEALRNKFDVNPYSLTQEDLEALRCYDKLEARIERLIRDVLIKKAVSNSLQCKL